MAKGSGSGGHQREVLFEFTSIGQQVRVVALDPETGIEVVIVAPQTATQVQMQKIAMAKLERRLERENRS